MDLDTYIRLVNTLGTYLTLFFIVLIYIQNREVTRSLRKQHRREIHASRLRNLFEAEDKRSGNGPD